MKPTNPDAWTPEQLDGLRRLYPTTSPQAVAVAIGRSLKSTYCKASELGIKSCNAGLGHPQTLRKGSPTLASKPCLPASKPAKAPARGPGYQPGEPIRTAQTRYTIAPTPPDPRHTNTYSNWG